MEIGIVEIVYLIVGSILALIFIIRTTINIINRFLIFQVTKKAMLKDRNYLLVYRHSIFDKRSMSIKLSEEEQAIFTETVFYNGRVNGEVAIFSGGSPSPYAIIKLNNIISISENNKESEVN